MYGSRVYNAVLASGDQATGVSVHLVDGEYDMGRVLAQCEVPVKPGDDVRSLSERVQRAEREFLVDVLGQIAEGSIKL
jgi:phosphoribosylglycinamide formyltransferase-1